MWRLEETDRVALSWAHASIDVDGWSACDGEEDSRDSRDWICGSFNLVPYFHYELYIEYSCHAASEVPCVSIRETTHGSDPTGTSGFDATIFSRMTENIDSPTNTPADRPSEIPSDQAEYNTLFYSLDAYKFEPLNLGIPDKSMKRR
jgi:hypothetical protein